MNDASLGANHLLSAFATCHAVTPLSSPLSSVQCSAAPPHGASGIPRCFWYHAASAAGSPLLLKKTPPIPVILAITLSSSNRALRVASIIALRPSVNVDHSARSSADAPGE